MWQSQIEIEHYSVVYFDRITVFEALEHTTSVKGGAQMRSTAASMRKVYIARMSFAPNGSTALQRFERGNTVKIHNGIVFDFYPGLPHIHLFLYFSFSVGMLPTLAGAQVRSGWIM